MHSSSRRSSVPPRDRSAARATGWPVIGRQRTRDTAPDGRFVVERNATGHGGLLRQPSPGRQSDGSGETATGTTGPAGSARVRVWLVLVVVTVLVVGAVWFLDYGRLDPLGSRDTTPPPAALPPFGSYVESQVQPDGTVRVSQWVRATEPIRSVRLESMPLPDAAGDRPVASRVRLVANGTELAGPDRLDGPHTYRLSAPARVVHAVYRVEGVAVPSATPGAQVVVTSVFLRLQATPRGIIAGPKLLDVRGPGLLGARCVATVGPAVKRPCGEDVKDRPDAVRVELLGDRRSDRVAALLDTASTGTS